MAGVAVRVGDEISGNVKTLKCNKNERGDNDTCESAQIYISQTVRCCFFSWLSVPRVLFSLPSVDCKFLLFALFSICIINIAQTCMDIHCNAIHFAANYHEKIHYAV